LADEKTSSRSGKSAALLANSTTTFHLAGRPFRCLDTLLSGDEFMLGRALRISDWPFIVKLIAGPALGLAALGFLAWLGISRIGEQSRTVDTLIRDQEASAKLDDATKGMQAINGGIYRVLTLQAAQTAGLDANAEMEQLGKTVNAVKQTLADYRDHYATVSQRPDVDSLIAEVEKYNGAIVWVTQMLDVDFASAVSFLKPFEATFAEMNNRLGNMVNALAIAARNDAETAAVAAAATRQTFQLGTAGAFTLVILMTLVVGLGTIRSIRRIASATLALANGNTNVDIASLHRRDELGAIVNSLNVFRDGLLRVHTLQTEQEQERDQAEAAKRAAMVSMA
jgi:methyl-accepting chemotaxis protein